MLFVILAILSAWNEVEDLKARGSWSEETFWLKSWGLKWTGFKRLFNSVHIPFGLFILGMCIMLHFGGFLFQISLFSQALNTIAQVIAHWLIFFYIRSLFMHCFFRKKDWDFLYIFPFPLDRLCVFLVRKLQ